MVIRTKQEILQAKKYSDLFSPDKDIMKKEFRAYCSLYHPDVDSSEEAKKIFGIIMEIYNNNTIKSVSNSAACEKYRFTNKDTGKGFELNNPIVFSNGICMVYHTSTKVVLVYDKSYEKFYKNYLRNINNITYADEYMRKEFERYFPNVVTSFNTVTDKFCILLNKTAEVLNLGVIVSSYEKMKENFPDKHAAWIINRLYNMVTYMHFNKKVFNGLSINNLWVSPEMHTVLFFNGWEYLTSIGETMIGCPKEVYNTLPVKVKGSHESCIETDLECIKFIGRKLFKNSNALNIKKFLEEGTLSTDKPLDVWKLYGEAVTSDYGKRKFIMWDNVPYNIK